jgi:hypothetical protein
MRAAEARFHELDDLVLRLKGLVLVRELRRGDHAGARELELYDAEIERARDDLADLVRKSGGGIGYPAAA